MLNLISSLLFNGRLRPMVDGLISADLKMEIMDAQTESDDP